MSERVTYKRLLRQFAAIGPYLREDLCEEGRYRFDCLSVCVSAKPAPDKREFWGWWLVLEQEDHSFSYHYQVGFYNADGEWINKPLPKKHQAEVERTLNHFYKLISANTAVNSNIRNTMLGSSFTVKCWVFKAK